MAFQRHSAPNQIRRRRRIFTGVARQRLRLNSSRAQRCLMTEKRIAHMRGVQPETCRRRTGLFDCKDGPIRVVDRKRVEA